MDRGGVSTVTPSGMGPSGRLRSPFASLPLLALQVLCHTPTTVPRPEGDTSVGVHGETALNVRTAASGHRRAEGVQDHAKDKR